MIELISPLIIFFFIYGIGKYFNNYKFIPISVVLLVWVIAFIPIWDVFGTVRFIFPTLPIIYLFVTVSIFDISKNIKYQNIFITLFLAVILLFSVLKVMTQTLIFVII